VTTRKETNVTAKKQKITLDLSPNHQDELERLAAEQRQSVTEFVVARIRKSGYLRAFAKE
jgi:uncharacterized protein (DUF1778 family)